MTKRELIKAVAERTGFKQAEVERILGELIAVTQISLACGEPVQLQGFGKIFVVDRAPTVKSINGRKVEVDGFKAVVFKPCAALKARVNK